MINKNFECLKRSPRQIAKDLGISPTTANDYIKNDLFKKSFGAESFYAKVKEENRRKRKRYMNDKANIPYKIKLSIYHLMKLCVKNFQALSKLNKRYWTNRSSDQSKKSKPITGSEILKYNKSILDEILSDESYLQDFQKNMLKHHESVKYAAVMNSYYRRFLDDISLLTALGIDGSVTDKSVNFAETIANIEEVIWLFNLKRAIGRDTDNPSQFNINNALCDVICEIDEYNDEKDRDYNGKSLNISTKEYNEKLKELESEYFERVKTQLKNPNLDDDTNKFYTSLNENREVFDDFYQNEYTNFFKEYITTDNKLTAIKRLIWNCTDIYGRLFIPISIQESDITLNILNHMISHIKANNIIKVSDISPDNIKMLRCHFIYIKQDDDTHHYYTKSYNEKSQTYSIHKYHGDVLQEFFGETAEKEYFTLIYNFSTFLCGETSEITLTSYEADILRSYFTYCIYTVIVNNFFKQIELVKKKTEQSRKILSSDKTYIRIKNSIDSSIAVKWADSMFKDCK